MQKPLRPSHSHALNAYITVFSNDHIKLKSFCVYLSHTYKHCINPSFSINHVEVGVSPSLTWLAYHPYKFVFFSLQNDYIYLFLSCGNRIYLSFSFYRVLGLLFLSHLRDWYKFVLFSCVTGKQTIMSVFVFPEEIV